MLVDKKLQPKVINNQCYFKRMEIYKEKEVKREHHHYIIIITHYHLFITIVFFTLLFIKKFLYKLFMEKHFTCKIFFIYILKKSFQMDYVTKYKI
jgi:hypothetical protein